VDTIISRSAQETFVLGEKVGSEAEPGAVLALVGELGAGKTQFVKGVAAGLGSTDPVTSPTFTLIHEYADGRVPLYHFDFYRPEHADEILRIGFDDYLASGGILAIEWADKFPELLPRSARWIRFVVREDDQREITEP
jgi:tRNA threonylcarbamoyladenosine biosynthesis protein TsaE